MKELLKREVPDINYHTIKVDVFTKIKDYERKRERERLYFMPKAGMNILIILLALNFYSFFEELSHFVVVERAHVALPSPLSRTTLSLVDNALLVGFNFFLITLLNKNFLQTFRIYRSVKCKVVSFASFCYKLPATTWSLIVGRS